MGVCDNDRKGQLIIEGLTVNREEKVQTIENILDYQASLEEYQSLYLNTTYVIHRMLYKLKDISDKERYENMAIYDWNEYEVLAKIQDEKYTEDIVRNKLLIMEYFKVLKKPVPKLIIDFQADVFIPTVVPTLKWTPYKILSENWHLNSKIHKDLTIIFALLYYNGAEVTSNETICTVKHYGTNKNSVTFEKTTFIVSDIVADIFKLYPKLDTVLVRNLWKEIGLNSYQFRWSGIYQRCLKYDKNNKNLIYLSITPNQVDTKTLVSFGFPEPRNNFDKDKMINRYKQWRTYFKL